MAKFDDVLTQIRGETPPKKVSFDEVLGQIRGDVGAPKKMGFDGALSAIRSGAYLQPPQSTQTVEPPTTEPPSFMDSIKGLADKTVEGAKSVAGEISHAVQGAASLFVPKVPTSFAEALNAIRLGQGEVPSGPAMATAPISALERAGKGVKEAASAALAVEQNPKAGLFSKILGKALMAPAELALGLPPGLLGKIEDAVGEGAISPQTQEVIRQTVLMQPFTPSEFQEAVGAEAVGAVFAGGASAGVESLIKKFPNMAARFGFKEAAPAIRSAMNRTGIEAPVTPEDIKNFVTGVKDVDPALAEQLKIYAGEVGREKFGRTVKDILGGKKFFVKVEPTVVTGAKKALPGPGEAVKEMGEVEARAAVEKEGFKFVGIQRTRQPGKEAMVLFNEPIKGSTILVPASKLTPEGMKAAAEAFEAKVAEAQAKYGGGTATPQSAGGRPSSPAEPQPPSGRPVSQTPGQAAQPLRGPEPVPISETAQGLPPERLTNKFFPLEKGPYTDSIARNPVFIKNLRDAGSIIEKYDKIDGVETGPDSLYRVFGRLHAEDDAIKMKDPSLTPAERKAAAERLSKIYPEYAQEIGPLGQMVKIKQGMNIDAYRKASLPTQEEVLKHIREIPDVLRPSAAMAPPRQGKPPATGGGGTFKEMEAPRGTLPPQIQDRAMIGDARLLSGGPPPLTPTAQAAEGVPPLIEMPEIVEIAHGLLGGNYPKVFEKIRSGIRGFFSPGKEEIGLSAEIAEDAVGAAKTLAHEIGHLTDWLPDKSMAKGNILGRIGSLRKYMSEMIESAPRQAGLILTPQERKSIHSQILAGLLKQEGKTLQQFIKDPALRKQVSSKIKPLYEQRIKEEAFKRGLITKEQAMKELKDLTQVWKPFDPKMDPKFTAYRFSAPELYADAVSVLFNNPALLKKVAPSFYKGWFNYLERKPRVRAFYHGITDRISGGKVLEGRQERVERMFAAGERQYAAERLAAEQKPRDLIAGLRQALIDKNEGVLAYMRKAKKMGVKVQPEDSPQYALEEMNYSGAEAKAWIQRYDEIYKTLEAAGLNWDRLGDVLFHQRVIQERGKLFNPLGFTPQTSEAQLEFLRGQMGNEKWAILLAQTEKFRQNWGFIVKKLTESGMLSEPLMKKIMENPVYATFDVFVKHADDLSGGRTGSGAKIYGQVGTLQEISNPATATLMKGVSLIKAINKNTATAKVADFLNNNFGADVIRPADEQWNNKARVPSEPKERGRGLIAYMEDGKIKGYVVDEAVAQSFKNDPGSMKTIADLLRLSMVFFREVFVQKNPGFMAFNLVRDFFRAYKNLPGINMAGTAKLYYKSLAESFRRGLEIPDQLVTEMLEKKMLITMEDKWGLSTEDEQVRALMDRYLGGRPEEGAGPIAMLKKALDKVEKFGAAIEALPKVSGYKYLKEHKSELGLSEQEIGHMIRVQIGSPDFLRKGSAHGIYNGILMFANPIKEGWRGDWEVFRDRPGEYAWKKAKLNFLPKLLMYGASLGMMGAGLKEIMDNASEYDKTNYTLIPLGLTPDGKAAYIRVPQDEAGRALSGIFWKILNSNREQSIADLFDFMSGQAPTLNPAIGLAFDISTYMSGKNPYDHFRQRNVIPDQVFEAGGMRSHAAFMKYIWNQAGLGIVHRFSSNDVDKVRGEVEKVLGAPLLSNTLGRFVKITDYGLFENLQRVAKKSRGEQAAKKLDERDAIVANINSVEKPGPKEAGALYSEMVKMGMLRQAGGLKVVPFSQFLADYNRFASRRAGDPYLNALIYARSNEERAALLRNYRENLPKEKHDKIISSAIAGGHLTTAPIILSHIEEKKNAK